MKPAWVSVQKGCQMKLPLLQYIYFSDFMVLFVDQNEENKYIFWNMIIFHKSLWDANISQSAMKNRVFNKPVTNDKNTKSFHLTAKKKKNVIQKFPNDLKAIEAQGKSDSYHWKRRRTEGCIMNSP